MASQWHSLISQKVFLAKSLLNQQGTLESVTDREACWQGAVELALRSRRLLLTMIARFYQDKQSEPGNLEALRSLLGDKVPELAELAELESLATGGSNWWTYLSQLERHQTRPPEPKKTVSEDNIIAVAADTGPDRSPEALKRALADLKQFTDVLEERHSEW